MREILDAIDSRIKKLLPRKSVIGQVVSYDDGVCEVDPLDESGNILGVKIQAEEDGDKGFVCVPKVGSTVIVSWLDDNEAYISMFSEVTDVLLISDSFGGLVKVEALVEKINALEDLVNTILDTLSTTTIPLAPSGTYPFAPLYASILPITPITAKADLENTKVKHGA